MANKPLTAQETSTYGTAPRQQVMGLSSAVTKVMDSQPGVQIRLQRRMLQALTGFEQNNKYIIKELKDRKEDEKDAAQFFFAVEKSAWVERNCYPADCAPWHMDVFKVGHGGIEKAATGKPLMHLERPCTATCCCLNRPEVFITDPASEAPIGSISDPFSCFDLTFAVNDAAGNPVLKSKASCWQFGMWCACPGRKIEFPIIDATTNEEVAHITKIWECGDLCPWVSSDLDNFKVTFGQLADPSRKALVMLLGIFIDYRYFNSRNAQ